MRNFIWILGSCRNKVSMLGVFLARRRETDIEEVILGTGESRAASLYRYVGQLH